MKQKDIAIIIVVASISGIISFFVANTLFGGSKTYNLTAPTVSTIDSNFKQVDVKYFNKNSLNPTKNITIGDSNNNKPFNQ